MLRPSHLTPAAGVTFALFLLSAVGRSDDPPAAKPAALPLARVTLFTAGVGHFLHEGTVDGTARVEFRFPEPDVNDLLKSLIAEDRDGGTVRAVTFDPRHPPEVTLKAFGVDLTENPSVGQLLQQVRGERVEITDKQGGVVAGRIVSVDRPAARVMTSPPEWGADGTPKLSKPVVVPPPADAVEQVNLMTDDGLESVPLARAKKVKFSKPELQAEFRRALEALAASGGDAKKGVAVTFAGQGKRRVRVGYVTEAPVWKPTYRLSVGDNAASLQGWAAVDNTTEADWTDVRVRLVSGRPIAYEMDLYDPLYVPRPTVEPQVFASLRPPTYQAGQPQMAGVGGIGIGGAGVTNTGFAGGMANNLGNGGGIIGFGGGQLGQLGGGFGQVGTGLSRPSVRELTRSKLSYDEFAARNAAPTAGKPVGADTMEEAFLPRRGVPADAPDADLLTAAQAGGLGYRYEYAIADPVTLPRLKTALLPTVTGPLDVKRVSVFNASTLPRHPLLSLRLTNTTKQYLAQGPLAVYDGGTFAGDSRLPDLRPGESRLLSYAVDLDVSVSPETKAHTRKLASAKVADKKVTLKRTERETTAYAARTRVPGGRAVLIEHPTEKDHRVVGETKPAERTATVLRFEVSPTPEKPATLEVAEEWDAEETLPLADANAEALRATAAEPGVSPAVAAVLTGVLDRRAKLKSLAKAQAEEEAGLKAVLEEQTRVRGNLEGVPADSDAYRRFLKKLDSQETEIEQRQARLKGLKADAERETAALAAFIDAAKAE